MSIAPLGSGPSALVHLHHGSPVVADGAVTDGAVTDDGGDGPDDRGAVADAPDSATFSDQAVALLQAQHASPVQDGGWTMTETQAAQLSAAIQQADPPLFDHLDQNGDGRLNADELKTGIHQLAQQAPAAAGGAATAPDQVETIRQALQSMLGGGLPGVHRHHHHQAAARGSAAVPAAGGAVVSAPASAADADNDRVGDSASSASSAAPQRSLADLLAELDRSAH